MKYVIDMDGVLADFNAAFARVLDPEGTIIPVKKGTWPEMWNWPHQFFPREYVDEAWERVHDSPFFWRDLGEFRWTGKTLHLLGKKQRMLGDEVYFVTARVGTRVKTQTELWLRARGYRNPTVIVVSTMKKWGVVNDLDADVVLDDKPKILTDIHTYATTSVRCYLQVHPYNMLFAGEHAERLGITPVSTPMKALQEEELA